MARRVLRRRLGGRLRGLAVSFVIVVVSVYAFLQLQIDGLPTSQAADLAAVIDAVSPASEAGLRADVFADVPADSVGCGSKTKVWAVISGTPAFWAQQAGRLSGEIRLGIGMRTGYDRESLRVAEWSGYGLPIDVANLSDLVRNPTPRDDVAIEFTNDTSTGVLFTIARIGDWPAHWTPIVMEFDANWTFRRSFGSCYLVLPELVSSDSATVSDANAAAFGARSVFDEHPEHPNAITYGRVMIRTTGHFLEAEIAPRPVRIDRNPWVDGFGQIGQEVAEWDCRPGPERDFYPEGGPVNPLSGEKAALPGDKQPCGGVAVIEARGARPVRDVGVLVAAGLFTLFLERLVGDGMFVIGAVSRRRRIPRGGEPADPPAQPPSES